MPYIVRVKPAAERDLKQLQRDIARRIYDKLRGLSNEPRPRGAEKLTNSADVYRIHVGTYRVLYVIDDAKKIVLVSRVRHRREVYR